MLVLGAGCSSESPTNLPLSGDLSEECFEKLLADGVLQPSDVQNPRDLSEVAEAVFSKIGSQEAVVSRFPPGRFRLAAPNKGYEEMAALFLEGALADTMTLNFDCAARTALAHLGAGSKVSVVSGPEDHTHLGDRNLIHLHRDIERPPDELILRSEQLVEAWQGHWEEVIARRVLSGPVVVFVGLGSPAAVLVETARWISDAIDTSNGRVFVVGPSEHDDSRFASALGISSEEYIRMGWSEFMGELSQRVIQAHGAKIRQSCKELSLEIGIQTNQVDDLCERLLRIGLRSLGQLRAAWMLDKGKYLPHQLGNALNAFSFLLSGILAVERETGLQAEFREDGIVEFLNGNRPTRALVCQGGGWMSAARVETELLRRYGDPAVRDRAPSFVLVSGLEGSSAIATPDDIVVESARGDLLTGPAYIGRLRFVRISDLRADPSIIHEVIE